MGSKLLRRIATWVDFAASVLSAGFLATLLLLVLADMKPRPGDPDYKAHRFHKALIAGTGFTLVGLLLAGAAARLYAIVARGTEGRYLVFDTPSGPVSFRAASVEQAINRTVAGMDEVADAALELVLPKGAKVPTEARVRCRLYDRPNLLAIQDQVRATVSDRYLEMFPGQEPLAVRISVERIVFETPGPKALPPAEGQPAAEASAETIPFRPQYPVGD